MEIMQTKVKLSKENGGWYTKDVEAVALFGNALNVERRTKRKNARVQLQIPDDWADEAINHIMGSRSAEHNFVLMKIPIGETSKKNAEEHYT